MAGIAGSRRCVLAIAALGLVLAGCSAEIPRPGPGMMMGQDSGNHYSSAYCSAPVALPGTVVEVTLADMGMTHMMGGTAPMGMRMVLFAEPAQIPSGPVSIVVTNRGWRTHELVVMPLGEGSAVGQRVPGRDGKVDETGSLGEASNSCAEGTGEGIVSGGVGWTTVTLAPGRYELLCNLPNHYADGMFQQLVVI